MRDVGDVRQVYRGMIIPASSTTGSVSEPFSEVLATQTSKDDAFEKAVSFVLTTKKGYVPGENPMKYGIMQATLKDYDPKGRIAQHVSQLDEAKAKQIYQKIWDRAGCDKLSYPLSVIHFDTYAQRPRMGIEVLRKAQGDPQAYLDIRKSVQEKLKVNVADPVQARSRVDQLAAYLKLDTAGAEAGAGTQSQTGTVQATQGGKKAVPPSNFDTATAFLIKHEGTSIVRNDNGKGPAKFGILQTTLKDYDPEGRIAKDVTQLDEATAKQIYKRIWQRAGCDKLPYPLNIIHFDTFMHRPNTAIQALGNADGDPQHYLELRQTSLRSLRGYKKFATAWEGRIHNLTHLLVNQTDQAAQKKPASPQVLDPERSG